MEEYRGGIQIQGVAPPLQKSDEITQECVCVCEERRDKYVLIGLVSSL